MKLRNLSGAIRKQKGAISLTWNSPHGPVLIETGKTSLLAALKAGFNDEAMLETGLTINEAGVLVSDGTLVEHGTVHIGVHCWRVLDGAADAMLDEDGDRGLESSDLLDEETLSGGTVVSQFSLDDEDLLLDDDEDAVEDVADLIDDLLG